MSASRLRDEEGTTMIELLVGMAMGMVVIAGLSMMIIVVLHGNARVDARVEATDNARVTETRIIEELHSACISPKIAPIQAGSSGTKLIFWHAAAGEAEAVQPKPVKSEIELAEGSLWQTDYGPAEGTSPNWTFPATGEKRKLLANVAAPTGGYVFSYSKYGNGGPVAQTETGLGETEASETIGVQVSLVAAPRSTPVADAGAEATVTNSATLRLTPPSYNETSSALPCQ